MSPAVTNPPNVKLASPNGSVGGTSSDPSFPLTTAITVFVPGPVTSTVSRTPSPLKSPVAARTSPPNPGNGVIAPPVGRPSGPNVWAVPPVSPETTNGRPAGGLTVVTLIVAVVSVNPPSLSRIRAFTTRTAGPLASSAAGTAAAAAGTDPA